MKTARDYQQLTERLRAAQRKGWRVERAGEAAGYPFFAVRRSIAKRAPTILLSAGMHGDEPAGVEAVLRWLESDQWRRWRVNWLMLPCINPYGWTHNRRTNADGLDINRQFCSASGCPEAEIVKRVLSGRDFLLAMDFHEDSDASGYYVCETKFEPLFAGERIVEAVRRVLPISRSAVLDGRRAVAPGVVRRVPNPSTFERRRQWPLAFHLMSCCTRHFLCSETPSRFPLAQRVRAHHAALHAALRQAELQLAKSCEPLNMLARRSR